MVDRTDEEIFKISIHTPTQGVTLHAMSNLEKTKISIHTPTQGVTAKLHNLDVK